VPSATAVNSFNINISCVPDKYQHTFAKFSRKIVVEDMQSVVVYQYLSPVALQALEQFFMFWVQPLSAIYLETDSQSDDDNNDMFDEDNTQTNNNTYNDNNNSNNINYSESNNLIIILTVKR